MILNDYIELLMALPDNYKNLHATQLSFARYDGIIIAVTPNQEPLYWFSASKQWVVIAPDVTALNNQFHNFHTVH